jgi:hypothetical protein
MKLMLVQEGHVELKVREIGCMGMVCVQLSHHMVKWQAFENMLKGLSSECLD